MAVIFDKDNKTFKLDSKNSSYIFKVGEGNYLIHLYYGSKISDVDVSYLIVTKGRPSFSPNSPSVKEPSFSADGACLEYSCNGTGDYRISALQIKGVNGSTATDIRYKSHKIYNGKPKIPGQPATYVNDDSEAQTLEVVTVDSLTGAEVTLVYTVFENLDVVTRSVKIKNTSEENFDIERVYSCCQDFTNMNYDMIHLYGEWAKERTFVRRKLEHGIQGLASKRGSSSHQNNPFVALVSPNATEDSGEAYGFSFVYSGNFAIDIEVDAYEATRVLMGINPSDFNWLLEPGEEFYSPEAVMVYSNQGIGEMSRTFHKLYRYNLCRGEWKTKKRPILVNNWEATYFNFDDDKLVAIAKDAAELGIEMLVMDDGWFGKRNDATTSLGDWFVNEEKIKGGLGKLVQRVNDLGLKFGIWFEPEMVSPVSELYKKHPEWALHVNGRDMSTGRNQYVLDMTRQDVRDYLFDCMSKIMDSANIEYIKWDFNRHLTEVGSELLPANRQKEVFHRYVLGLYELLERLLTAYPKLLLEGCSGGGGRYDPAMLYYSPQIWTSDDTDAIERVDIQYGTSIVYPPSSMSAHVSASPNHQTSRNTSMETRGNVAMAGAFGYELDLNQLNDEDKEWIKKQVADYHKYYDVVQNGDYYRLVSPYENRHVCAWEYVSQNKEEVLFTFVVMRKSIHRYNFIKLKGLNPDMKYKETSTGEVYYGDTLMNAGLNLTDNYNDGESLVRHFIAIK